MTVLPSPAPPDPTPTTNIWSPAPAYLNVRSTTLPVRGSRTENVPRPKAVTTRPSRSLRIIRSAIDRGITLMDNCWDYHNGESERRMGLALGDGYRQKVFLMTKFDGRTRDSTA